MYSLRNKRHLKYDKFHLKQCNHGVCAFKSQHDTLYPTQCSYSHYAESSLEMKLDN